MYVDNLINTVGRSKLTTDQAKADTGAGKSNVLASKRIDNVLQANKIPGPDGDFAQFDFDWRKTLPKLLKSIDGKPIDMSTDW